MTTKHLHARVSPRLLTELPRFFGGFESALGELFQNAYRAGAQNVRVTYRPADRMLALADDGAGLDDPQKLLTAGETGWDEARIVEPAGIGAFAILRDEFVTDVEYASRGAWRMALTPAVLRGAPAQVETRGRRPRTGKAVAPRHGLTVTLHLQPGIAVTEKLVRRARGLYPFRVHYTDGDGKRTLAPWRAWEPNVSVTTPLGLLEWRHMTLDEHSQHANEAVWECRPLASLVLRKALEQAKRPRASDLAQFLLDSGRVRWFVNPTSGVRAKLPDRNELQDDNALARAAGILLDALVERVLTEMRDATRDWPARIEDIWKASAGLPEWQRSTRLLGCTLPVLGWRKVCFTNLNDVYVYDASDGVEIESSSVTQYDRDALLVASAALNLSLNALGHAASYTHDAVDPRVMVSGLRMSEESSHVALAARIHVEGVGDLPYLVTEDTFDLAGLETVGAAIIFAGSAADFIAALNDSDALAHALFLHNDDNHEWIEWDSGEAQIAYQRIRDEVTLQVTRAFAPELTEARMRYYAVDALREPAGDAVRAVENVLHRMDAVTDEAVSAQRATLDECREILKALTDLIGERARDLAAIARL